MSALGARLNAIAAALQAKYPARKVKRAYVDFNLRQAADLAAGIYTIVGMGEKNFTNVPGYAAKDAAQPIRLIGQIQLPESKDAEALALAVDEAEFTMAEEVKAFLDDLPEALSLLAAITWTQSHQIEAPYGWVAFELEYTP